LFHIYGMTTPFRIDVPPDNVWMAFQKSDLRIFVYRKSVTLEWMDGRNGMGLIISSFGSRIFLPKKTDDETDTAIALVVLDDYVQGPLQTVSHAVRNRSKRERDLIATVVNEFTRWRSDYTTKALAYGQPGMAKALSCDIPVLRQMLFAGLTTLRKYFTGPGTVPLPPLPPTTP